MLICTSLQLRILQRAMDMLQPGGRMVYSTCSFNPSENEAVISAGLNSRPGMSRDAHCYRT
jgi:multisite-specific tRNA:(cytosine-C5)-methyltransferase